MKQQVPPGPGEGLMFASEIIKIRQDRGLTQSQLSDQSGVSLSAIKGYETGRNLPGARELRAICTALRVSPNRLLFGTEQPFVNQEWLSLSTSANEEEDTVQRARAAALLHLLSSEERQSILTLIKSIAISRHGEAVIRDCVYKSDYNVALVLGMHDDDRVKDKTGHEVTFDEKLHWLDDFLKRYGHD